MIAVDAGVIVAAFSSWHEVHTRARDSIGPDVAAVGHALVEAFSVLTRLPPPHRAPAPLAASFLGSAFTGAVLTLEGSELRDLVLRLPELSIVGGAVYDALIGATAAAAGATLLTLDRRALGVYERVGCQARLLGA